MEMGYGSAITDGVGINRRVGSMAHWEYQENYAVQALSDGLYHNFTMTWDPLMICT